MFVRATHWLLLLAASSILVFISGCATNEAENASVRPWNSPQNWEGGLGGFNTQRR